MPYSNVVYGSPSRHFTMRTSLVHTLWRCPGILINEGIILGSPILGGHITRVLRLWISDTTKNVTPRCFDIGDTYVTV